jgi:hypothetical protein
LRQFSRSVEYFHNLQRFYFPFHNHNSWKTTPNIKLDTRLLHNFTLQPKILFVLRQFSSLPSTQNLPAASDFTTNPIVDNMKGIKSLFHTFRFSPVRNAVPLTEFRLFPKLPGEIRIKIWVYATLSPRIIKVLERNLALGGNGWIYMIAEKRKLPEVLLACWESRVTTKMLFRGKMIASWLPEYHLRKAYGLQVHKYQVDPCTLQILLSLFLS